MKKAALIEILGVSITLGGLLLILLYLVQSALLTVSAMHLLKEMKALQATSSQLGGFLG